MRSTDRLRETKDAGIRSGISLAIGSIDRPDPQAKENWRAAFARWYTERQDSGTHSAAGWAMRRWGRELPALEPMQQPAEKRSWWVTPLKLTMLRVPPGQVAADNGPIVIHEPFWLSDREISIAVFKQFMADEQANRPDDWQGAYMFKDNINGTHPVQKVSWEDAVMFCNWLSDRHGLERCYKVELLDEQIRDRNDVLQKYRVTFVEENDGFRLPK